MQKPLNMHFPESFLSPYIRCFWFGEDAYQTQFHIIPDGCIDIVIQQGPGCHQFAGVYGSSTAFLALDITPGCRYIGIRFQPGQARHFINIPAWQLTDNFSDEPQPFLRTLAPAADCRDSQQVFSSLEKCCRDWLAKAQPEPLYLDRLILQLSHHSNLRLVEFCSEKGISERHLQRLFKNYVGITPKLYLKLERAERFKRLLQSFNQQTPLAQLALAAGYADQSHMQREFKLFNGQTPLSFLQKS